MQQEPFLPCTALIEHWDGAIELYRMHEPEQHAINKPLAVLEDC